MSEEQPLAEMLAFVLAGRAERLTAIAVAQMPPEQRELHAEISEALANVGLQEAPIGPPPSLRSRILETVQARAAVRRRKALVICDMIRDHLVPGGPLEIPRARDIVPAIARRIEEARASGVPVVYVLDRHPPGDPEFEEWMTHAVEGSEGAEVWPPLAPAAGDHLVTKPSYSGFHDSQLGHVLDDLAVDTLVLTGCATEVQLMATATDALERGFAVELPVDSQAGASEMGENLTLGVLSALVPYAPARRARLRRIQQGFISP